MHVARKNVPRAVRHVRARATANGQPCVTPQPNWPRNIPSLGGQTLPRGTSSRRHVFTAVAAAACWLVLAFQWYVSVRVSRAAGAGALDGVWVSFAFFTVLTNVLAAAQLTVPLVAPHSAAGKFLARGDTLAGVAVNIALVCITYNLLLRGAVAPASLEGVSDELLHDFIPPLFVAHAWMKANANPVAMAPRLRWAVWPVLYFCYVLLRGAATGFYPYPFLDVSEHGYAGVLAIGAGLLAGYTLLAAVLFRLDQLRWRPLGHGWRPRSGSTPASCLARLRS